MRFFGVGLIVGVLSVLLLPALALARGIEVPYDYPTIQAAIDACVQHRKAIGGGEFEISVYPGTYHENIDFKGLRLQLYARRSSPLFPGLEGVGKLLGFGSPSVIIRGTGNGPVVTIASGEGPEAVLRGFTITGGNAPRGGGIYCNGTSPILRDNVITGNAALNGGGIACVNASPVLRGNSISNNSATGNGGGIHCNVDSQPEFTGNIIAKNSAGEAGGGMYCGAARSVSVINNTFAHNTARSGGALYLGRNCGPVIKNTIIAFNAAGGGLRCADATSQPLVSYCDLFGNIGGDYVNFPEQTGVDGNICVDPLFADPTNENYCLRSVAGHHTSYGVVGDLITSPCIDAGDPASPCDMEPGNYGGRINMGFEGNTEIASGTPLPNPSPRMSAWGPKTTGIAAGASISIGFNMAMARRTVEDRLLINGVKAREFGGVFTWSGRKMTFNPASDFQPETQYEITLMEGFRSRAGAVSTWRHFWVFTTRAADPAPALAVSVAAAPTVLGAQVAVHLASAADVTLSIRNMAGREVAVLSPGTLPAGMHSLLWDGKSKTGTKVPAGMYLLEVMARGKGGDCARAMATLRR